VGTTGLTHGGGLQELAVETDGVRIVLGASDSYLLTRMAERLPLGSVACENGTGGRRLALVTEENVGYRILGTETQLTAPDLNAALKLLDSVIRVHIARHAARRVFLHAGVVGYGGRAIVVPGSTFSGKTTLVAALLRAGASYYSDDCAVLDEDGLVHPYTRRLSVRDTGGVGTDRAVEAVGGYPADEPAPVGLIAITSYRPGADWRPVRGTTGRGMLALLESSLAAQERPAATFTATRAAATGAVVLEGERGEADEVAVLLLEALSYASGAHFPPG
jgi:hypothetical protein